MRSALIQGIHMKEGSTATTCLVCGQSMRVRDDRPSASAAELTSRHHAAVLFLTVQSINGRLPYMGRSRSFDNREVLDHVRTVFLERGFEGASIDDLVKATGLLRGSLYGAFGSKRGMFVAALRYATSSQSRSSDVLNLVLVALMELSNRDSEIRGLVSGYLESLSFSQPGDDGANLDGVASLLGRTLLEHGNVRLNLDGEGR